MSGELQTIPARHGVATFVPRGRTIKVINTYGKQVVSMWAFTLGPPPEEEEEDEEKERGEEEVKKEAEEVKGVVEGGGKGEGKQEEEEEEGESAEKELEDVDKESNEEKAKEEESAGKESQDTTKEEDKTEEEHEDPPEQAPDTPENEKTTENTESASQQPSKRTWSSYLPSIPYRNKGKAEKGKEPNAEEEKAQSEENTKRWSSYLPTGKAISSYVPNVQLPDSKNVVSAFKATHPRDPNKSYAEQLYDFSKTPVGAGTIAAATGSGYASSVYAAYSAYTSTSPFRSSQPPMEFLSLPHTRASSYKLVPEVNDELLTNLRNPIIMLIEDTTPGAHDTLTAACDANLYTALGVDKPEEHGSCAENLVIALKELNESAGLKGAKAIGADVSVNVAPTPLHLFMNAPLQTPSSSSDKKQSEENDGVGAKGTTVTVAEPAGKKRSFVRFRAERDVVIVFSACPMDIGPQNGGRCMAANFMVEDVQEGEDLSASVASMGKKKAPKKIGKDGAAKKKDEGEKKKEVVKEKEEPKKAEKKEEKPPARRDSGVAKPNPPARKASEKKDVKKAEKEEKVEKEQPKPKAKKAEQPKAEKKEESKAEKEQPKPKEPAEQQNEEDAKPAKKKPKKLQVRSKSSQNVTKTAS